MFFNKVSNRLNPFLPLVIFAFLSSFVSIYHFIPTSQELHAQNTKNLSSQRMLNFTKVFTECELDYCALTSSETISEIYGKAPLLEQAKILPDNDDLLHSKSPTTSSLAPSSPPPPSKSLSESKPQQPSSQQVFPKPSSPQTTPRSSTKTLSDK
jgi:hypothetical protein